MAELNKKELETLLKKIDIKKFLEYGQILIEFNNSGASVTGCLNDDVPETEYIEFQVDYFSPNNREVIASFCRLTYLIKEFMGVDLAKHAEYRFLLNSLYYIIPSFI